VPGEYCRSIAELLALTDMDVDEEVLRQMEAGTFAKVSLLGLDQGWKQMTKSGL
jgi:hypothetical protein